MAIAICSDTIYCKIPKISPGAYIFPRHLFEGLIFGGAHVRRGLCMEGNLCFKIDWASLIVGSTLTVFALFYFNVFEGSFSKYKLPEGLYSEGRFNGGFLALLV